jgi:hypothetical protein
MTQQSAPEPTPSPESGGSGGSGGDGGHEPTGHVVIVGPDGQPVGTMPASALQPSAEEDSSEADLTRLVEQPAKVMRIGSMIRQLLEEVKAAPLDDASRKRLKEIHRNSIKELETGLAPELVEELERLTLPFTGDETPSDAELRISQAQLVGWLEGLFHGIQTAIYAQQMVSRATTPTSSPAPEACTSSGRSPAGRPIGRRTPCNAVFVGPSSRSPAEPT